MELNEKTFALYAAKAYDNPQCSSMEEFEEDLKRFQYLKRLFNRYERTNELKSRLILNHIIVIYNCFGLNSTNMLFMKLKDHSYLLKPFLIKLSLMPDNIEYEGEVIRSTDISMDQTIIEELRKI